MYVTLIQEFPEYQLAYSTFEKCVIRFYDGSLSVHVQNVLSVLNEVKLRIAGGSPEIFANKVLGFASKLIFVGYKSDTGFLTNEWLG